VEVEVNGAAQSSNDRTTSASAIPVRHSARPLAVLYALTNLARLILLAAMPIQALRVLGDAQAMSLLYLVASAGSLATNCIMPVTVTRLGPAAAYYLIGGVSLAGLLMLASGSIILFCIGAVLFISCSTSNETLLSIVVLENQPRAEHSQYEAKRMTYSVPGFVVAPMVGVIAAAHVGPAAPFMIAVTAVAAALVCMSQIDLRDRVSKAAVSPNILIHFRRFLSQPRLRLAYALSAGRTAWWQMFFVYGPLFLMSSGFAATTAGLIISGTQVGLICVPFWSRIANWLGLRKFAVTVYLTAAVIVVPIALVPSSIQVILLVVAACCVTALDAIGNVYFLRAVRPFERREMATVFSTHRDAAQALPPAVFTPLLQAVELPVLFAASGLGLLAMATLARYLPRRL
jgi:predicted MFS family arabinose efflux permease